MSGKQVGSDGGLEAISLATACDIREQVRSGSGR